MSDNKTHKLIPNAEPPQFLCACGYSTLYFRQENTAKHRCNKCGKARAVVEVDGNPFLDHIINTQPKGNQR